MQIKYFLLFNLLASLTNPHLLILPRQTLIKARNQRKVNTLVGQLGKIVWLKINSCLEKVCKIRRVPPTVTSYRRLEIISNLFLLLLFAGCRLAGRTAAPSVYTFLNKFTLLSFYIYFQKISVPAGLVTQYQIEFHNLKTLSDSIGTMQSYRPLNSLMKKIYKK